MLAVLNLLVALVAMSSGAPSEAITMKFNAFVLLAVLGGALYYFGKKNKTNK